MAEEIKKPIKLFNPRKLSQKELETIRRIARVVMDSAKCDYTKAVIIAYMEWHNLVEVDEVEH